MNLENIYKKAKNSKPNVNIITVILAICSFLGIICVLNYLWNYVAPAWNLPILNYKQFLISWILVKLLSLCFFINRGDYKMISFGGDNPYGKK